MGRLAGKKTNEQFASFRQERFVGRNDFVGKIFFV